MKLEGIIPAVITPMHEDQTIDTEAMKKHVDFLIDKGVHGLFILGTNGEFHVLSEQEKIDYAKAVIDYTKGRVPVYVGAGACATQEAIRLAQAFEEAGADAVSVITPYLVKISQKEIEDHYRMIAASISIPVILYNIPANTGMNIEPQTVASLLDVENIIGIKDSSGNMDILYQYIEVSKNNDFNVLVGSDSKIYEALKLGATGAVASTSNVIPEHILSIYHEFMAGNEATAASLQKDVDVLRAVNKKASVPAILKRCITVRGISVGEARYPVARIGNQYDEEIQGMLRFYNLI